MRHLFINIARISRLSIFPIRHIADISEQCVGTLQATKSHSFHLLTKPLCNLESASQKGSGRRLAFSEGVSALSQVKF